MDWKNIILKTISYIITLLLGAGGTYAIM